MTVDGRLESTFARLRDQCELGLFPFLTAGFPDPTTCGEVLEAMAMAGADGFELGLPFSDPLADGVTMQRASARALEHGIVLTDAFDIVRGLRRRCDLPVTLMSYVNPLLAYGFERFCRNGADAGLDGVIIPDVPLEEAEEFRAHCERHGIRYVYMVAPTSAADRMESVGRVARGFVYCVTLVGTTGARTELSDELPTFLRAARATIPAPLVAGFGISTPGHVAALHGLADGVIVSSAIADLIERTGLDEVVDAVMRFVSDLKAATRGHVQIR